MGIDMETRFNRDAAIEHQSSHQLSPQQRTPVIRSRIERCFVKQAVVACRERVVHNDLTPHFCQSPELIEIPERVEESRTQAVSAARRLRGFGKPDRPAGLELVTKRPIKSQRSIRSRKPLFGKCRFW